MSTSKRQDQHIPVHHRRIMHWMHQASTFGMACCLGFSFQRLWATTFFVLPLLFFFSYSFFLISRAGQVLRFDSRYNPQVPLLTGFPINASFGCVCLLFCMRVRLEARSWVRICLVAYDETCVPILDGPQFLQCHVLSHFDFVPTCLNKMEELGIRWGLFACLGTPDCSCSFASLFLPIRPGGVFIWGL